MSEIAKTADTPVPVAKVVAVYDRSMPYVPAMHVLFDTGHTLSIIQPVMNTHMLEIAVFDENGDWVRNPHWCDDVYRVLDIGELNDEVSTLIPGYQPVSMLPKGVFSLTE